MIGVILLWDMAFGVEIDSRGVLFALIIYVLHIVNNQYIFQETLVTHLIDTRYTD